jgi:hypothetical protein
MSLEPFETAEAHGVPQVRQISTFLENKVGALVRLTKAFEGTDIRIFSLSIINSVDCAIVRLLVDHTDHAEQVIRKAGFPVSTSELLIVELPPGKTGLLSICSALLAGEVNILYAYPLLTRSHGRSALALQVDDVEDAAAILEAKRFTLLDEGDLRQA